MELDLTLLRPAPEYAAKALLTIEALAPLSMVAKMPGKYYRSQPAPTDGMILAMLENALGWHISVKERQQLLKVLSKRHKSPAQHSDVGFGSILQWHVRIATRDIPESMHYDDLWAQHLRGSSFPDGSRNYDSSLIPLMNAKRRGDITTGDTKDARREPELLQEFNSGDKINIALLRPHFPQYYASPTPREYIVPEKAFRFRIETSPTLAEMLSGAITSPAAPLYLGSNDGWIDVQWEEL